MRRETLSICHHCIPCCLIISSPQCQLSCPTMLAYTGFSQPWFQFNFRPALCSWTASISPSFHIKFPGAQIRLTWPIINHQLTEWLLRVRCPAQIQSPGLQRQVTWYHVGLSWQEDSDHGIFLGDGLAGEGAWWVSEAGTGLIHPVQVWKEKERSKGPIWFLPASLMAIQCFHMHSMNEWKNTWENKWN